MILVDAGPLVAILRGGAQYRDLPMGLADAT
jgi:hypothetical protein